MAEETDSITVEELKERFDRKEAILLLDVREQFEYDTCNIGGVLIPLGELPGRLAELDRQKEILVLCHHGNRSGRATSYLLQSGFQNVRNIAGGIDAWSVRVDPSVRRY